MLSRCRVAVTEMRGVPPKAIPSGDTPALQSVRVRGRSVPSDRVSLEYQGVEIAQF